MGNQSSEEKGKTKESRGKSQRNDADAKGCMGSAPGKSEEAGAFSNSIDHQIRKGRGRIGGQLRQSAGGILRQLVHQNQTQLAFLEEQIKQLKKTQLQLKFLCDEFAKAEVVTDADIQQFSDEELE